MSLLLLDTCKTRINWTWICSLDEGVIHGDKISWNFIAPNVHDFSWAADPNFIHDIKKVPDGPDLHFFYEESSPYISFWQDFQDPQ